MKTRKQKCSNCSGRKTIAKTDLELTVNYPIVGDSLIGSRKPCPNCNGEGEEYIISPKQWKEYKFLEKIADKLEAKHVEVAKL